ncbi:hypothetical protein PVK06_027282 [Gossypium arboreum]|uniref:Uncharacterized protein n=1 Tax=Gossypium arboreum TaxID=29729 RepID=A0ABR0P2S5_GOSAR|nr:hypothetical protein PVK06_027282 [Gossypium arboreum]
MQGRRPETILTGLRSGLVQGPSKSISNGLNVCKEGTLGKVTTSDVFGQKREAFQQANAQGSIKMEVGVKERLLDKEKHNAVVFKSNQSYDTKGLISTNSDGYSKNALTYSSDHNIHGKIGIRRRMNLSKTIHGLGNSFKVSSAP